MTTKINGWVTKLLATCLWGALVSAIVFMGNVVRGNDLKNIEDHVKIRSQIHTEIKEFRKEVRDDMKDLKLDIIAAIKTLKE